MSGAINDGGPAFPTRPVRLANGELDADCYAGMGLRDWFAGQALPGAVDHVTLRCRSGMTSGIAFLPDYLDPDKTHAREAAMMAYALADAMLEARGE